jgi:hypothetical protein
MTTTCEDLVNETLRYLYAGARDPQNKIAQAMNASIEVMEFTYDLGPVQPGAVVAVDLELMYVWAIDNLVTKTVTVERGYLGSTAAAHDADAVATINPKFSNFTVFEALNADLDDLSGNGLFQVESVELTYTPAIEGYDLTSVTDLLEVLNVKYEDPGPSKRWPEIKAWDLRRDSDTGDFASGLSLVLNEGGSSGRPVRVTYSAPFSRFATLATTIASTGLPATAHDVPPLGAALRLQSVREGQRNFNESQPATRRAQEVQAGAQLIGARGLQEMRRQRIRIEARRLQTFWPHKIKLPS